MKKLCLQLFGIVSLLLSPGLAQSQSYSIDWFTIDGGGGTSTGGVYTVSGTIGQPDAGVLSGGNYALVGGFWGIIAAVQVPGAPELFVTRDLVSGAVTLLWPNPSTGFGLQENADLGNPLGWVNVATAPTVVGTNKTVTVTSPLGNRFYRLRNPPSP
jgi:hypothetical protein